MDNVVGQDGLGSILKEAVGEIEEPPGEIENTNDPEQAVEAAEGPVEGMAQGSRLAPEGWPVDLAQGGLVPHREDEEEIQCHGDWGQGQGDGPALLYAPLKSWVGEEEEAIDEEDDVVEEKKVRGEGKVGIYLHQGGGDNREEEGSPPFKEAGQAGDEVVLELSADEEEEGHQGKGVEDKVPQEPEGAGGEVLLEGEGSLEQEVGIPPQEGVIVVEPGGGGVELQGGDEVRGWDCLLYTSPSPRD